LLYIILFILFVHQIRVDVCGLYETRQALITKVVAWKYRASTKVLAKSLHSHTVQQSLLAELRNVFRCIDD